MKEMQYTAAEQDAASWDDDRLLILSATEEKSKGMRRLIIGIVSILLCVIATLFIVAFAARYSSVFQMLGDMGNELAEVFRRIFS